MARPIRFHHRKEWMGRHSRRKSHLEEEEKLPEDETCHRPFVYVLGVILEEDDETTERNLRTNAISTSKSGGLSRSRTTSNLHQFFQEASMSD
jgi:hypothetical protein